MNQAERRNSQKLIERASAALRSIAMEEVVETLHRRFVHRWEWEAFKKHLVASEKELIGTKDEP